MKKPIRLNSRERVLNTIKHGEVDRMPRGELCINDDVICREQACTSPGFDEKYAFVKKLGMDIYSLSPVSCRAKDALPQIQDITWPDIDRWTGHTSLFTFAIVDGAFEVGVRMFKDLEFLIMYRTSPLAFKEFILNVEELNISMIRNLSDNGIDGVIIADDIAYRGGFLINPSVIREYFLPSLERQVEEIHKRGLTSFYHSDGNYFEIIPDLIKTGVNGIQCIEQSCGMNILELQAQFGSRLCLWGHLDVDDTKNAKDPVWLERTGKSLKELWKREGIILGTNCGLFADMDIEGLRDIYNLTI